MPPKKRVSAATQIYREVDGEAPAHTPVKRQKLDRRSALTEKQGNRTNSSGSSRNLRSTDDSAASSTPKKPLKSRNVRAVVKKEDLENVNLDVELADEAQPPKIEISRDIKPIPKKYTIGEVVYEYMVGNLKKGELGQWKDIRLSSADELADLIHKKGTWTPELLRLFQSSDITTITLTAPTDPYLPHDFTPLLTVLFTQNSFLHLTKLSLASLPLNQDHVSLLRLIPNLADLDLSSTGISTHALHHLVCHRHTLTTLNLNNNSAITDDARVALTALNSLKALYLRGTGLTMPGLRRFITDLPFTSTVRLIMVPEACIHYLNERHTKYQTEISSPMVADPRLVGNLPAPVLKRNIEYHARVNKDIITTGTKVDMVARLQQILTNRAADEKIVRVLGKGS